MSITHDPNAQQQPLFAPRSLIIRFIDGVFYDNAKKFIEDLGLTVHKQSFFWTRRHTLRVTTPDDNLDSWIAKLYTNPIIRLVEKERFSFPITESNTSP